MSNMQETASEPMAEHNAKYYARKCKTKSLKSSYGFHFLPPGGMVIAGYCLDFGQGIDYGFFFPTHAEAVAKSEDPMFQNKSVAAVFEIVPLFCAQVGK